MGVQFILSLFFTRLSRKKLNSLVRLLWLAPSQRISASPLVETNHNRHLQAKNEQKQNKMKAFLYEHEKVGVNVVRLCVVCIKACVNSCRQRMIKIWYLLQKQTH